MSSQSGTKNGIYSGSCEILHVSDDNTDVLEEITSENCIMSTLSTSLEAAMQPKGLALKFTAEGLETYWLQNKPYKIESGKYLLVNESVQTMEVVIKNTTTWGMCVDLDMRLVNDLLYQLFCPDDLEGYHQISRFLLSPELFVREAVASDRLKCLLNKFIAISLSGSPAVPSLELIYELITLLIEDNLELVRAYYKLQLAKLSTRKELFRRLMLGKEVLDDSLFSDRSIGEVADVCCLSEFRFYRLFKQCFGISPYHYLVHKRIVRSIELNKQGLSWSDIAAKLTFSDLAAFSNGFKKVTGVAPTKFQHETNGISIPLESIA